MALFKLSLTVSIWARIVSIDLRHVVMVQPGTSNHRDEVRVELQGIEQPREETLALGASETRGHFQAGGFYSPKISLGLLGEDACVNATLIYLDDLDL